MIYDAMSGASPLYFNTLSGASGLGITEYRTAGDVKVTKYFDGAAVGVGGAVSSERDYLSRAFSLDARFSTRRPQSHLRLRRRRRSRRDQQRQWRRAQNEHRNTLEYLFGVTQALSADAIIQSNLT